MPNYFNPYQQMYNPNYYPSQPNAYPQQVNAVNPQPNGQPQIQNGGFMTVPNEDVVKTYPVAPGNCVTFKIEGQPIVMEKSMGFSQLESPKIDRYRLERDDTFSQTEATQIGNEHPQLGKLSTRDLECEIDKLWCEIQALKATKNRPTGKSKREVSEDDSE